MAKRIVPTPEQLRQLLEYDAETGKLFWKARPEEMFSSYRGFRTFEARFAGKEAFTASSGGYRVGRIFDVMYRAHRVAWAIYHGEWPKADIDHINLDGADNRIDNLREATKTENLRNIGIFSSNKSGYKGVSWDKGSGRWVARVSTGERYKYLGRFDTKERAAKAYETAARKYHGEFMRLSADG